MMADSNPLSGGAAVVRALARNGVSTVFGIPGTHNLEIYRHLATSDIEHVAVRHEQGAGYAADGYARVSGRPGVCITTSGPGLTNACTAAATAHADSVPLLIISPGVPRGMEQADAGLLHEVKDQQAHLAALVARSERVHSADEAAAVIDEVFARWPSERPRPVYLEIPLDVLEAPWTESTRTPRAPTVTPPRADDHYIAEAIHLLAHSRCPALLLGGGARGASEQARLLAERLQAAVITTVNGKGVVPESHPLSLGASIRLRHAQRLLETADVVLVVGSEVGDSDLWGGSIQPGGAVIRVDIDAGQLQKNLRATVAIHGDSREILSELLNSTPLPARDATPEWMAQIVATRAALHIEALYDGAGYREIQEILKSSLPENAIVAGDSAQVSYYGTVHFWPMEAPGRFLYPTGYATLGYGLPAAIGAKVANRTQPVVALVGDGGFLFTVEELATAVEQRLCLPIVVVDNGGFGEIRDEMERRGVPAMAVNREPVDLSALSRAIGGRGELATSIADLPRLLEASLAIDMPTVIQLRL